MKHLSPFAAARWTARVLSLGILGLWGFFLVAHLIGGAEEPGLPLTPTDYGILAGMGLWLLGLALAWKRETIGGLIALFAFLGVAALNPRTLAFPLLLIPIDAALFLLVGEWRRRRRNAVLGWLVAAIALPALLATPAGATQWKIPCAIGYGAGTGLALVGLTAAGRGGDGMDGFDGVFEAAGVGLGVGTVVGFVIGSTADKRIGQGTPLSPGHRNAVRVGTVLCGGLCGAVAGGMWIDRAEDSAHDGEIVLGSIAAGMALGGLALAALDGTMDGTPRAAPVVRPASQGRPAEVGLAFRW